MSLMKCVVCHNDTDMDEEDRLPTEYGFCVGDELCSTCRIIYSMAGGNVSHHGEADDLGHETERYEGGKAYVIQKCREYLDRRERERYLANEGREPIDYEGHTYKRYWSPTPYTCNQCGFTTSTAFDVSCVEIDGVKHCAECAAKLVKEVGYISWYEDGEKGITPIYPWEYEGDRKDRIFQVPQDILDVLDESCRLHNIFLEWLRGMEEEQYQKRMSEENE